MYRLLFCILIITPAFSELIKINLITTNDIHGVIEEQKANFMNPQYPPTILGGSAFSKYVDELRIKSSFLNEGIIVLDGGNFFQGSPLGMYDKGKTMIDWMNRIGYDAIVPGIYDFIEGSENLNKLTEQSTFPFLSSNVYCNNCPLVSSNFKPYIIKDISGIKLGILGIINSKLSELSLEKNIYGIDLKSEVKSIKKWIPIMKNGGAEIIIVLTSSGVPWNRDEAYLNFIQKLNDGKINENMSLNALEMGYFAEDVDFIVSGGNSKGYWLPWYDPYSHTYIMQGYGGGTEFSHIKLLIDSKSHLFMGYETVIDGKASQTLLADDFTSNFDDAKWIKTKSKESLKNYYSLNNTSESNNISVANKSTGNNWDFPDLNQDNSIEIATWNCEFFPNANDSTILALSEAILELNIDIIAFQEIRKVGWFSKLMTYLPEYSFVVSKQSSFMDLAIIFKTDQFMLKNQIELFAENDYNFAGRPPLQADFIYKINNKQISIINLHMKCCDSGLNRRKMASKMLYEYLNNIYETQSNIIVLGDWNDDTKDHDGEHCFEPFFNDERFYFTTKKLAMDISKASYPKEPYLSFLDHILISKKLLPPNSNYFVDTINMGKYMGGYEIYDTYISDHLPVLLSFSVTN